jgi:2-polyprenyl-3-methyl-5-hydroxy-6-metoxy-1,4-benzoquinol methylase
MAQSALLKSKGNKIMRQDLYSEMYRQEEYYWWHVGKRKIVKTLLKKYNLLENPLARILDVGCGTGMILKEISSQGEVWGLDNDEQALKFCRKRGLRFLKKANLQQKLPFEDQSFDVILCLDVLEHLKNEDLSISEFRRLLKPKGMLVITVPAYPALWSYWDEISGHQRRYSPKTLVDLLKRNNFQVTKLSYFNFFVFLPVVLIRIFKSILGKKAKSRGDYTSDFIELPVFLNNFLLFLAEIERAAIIKINIPAGLSLVCLGRKK